MQQPQPTSIKKKYISECVVQETSAEIVEFKSRLVKLHPFTCTEGCLILSREESNVFLTNCKGPKAAGPELVHYLQSWMVWEGDSKGFLPRLGSYTPPTFVFLAVATCKIKRGVREETVQT